jgi:hypothetical protein
MDQSDDDCIFRHDKPLNISLVSQTCKRFCSFLCQGRWTPKLFYPNDNTNGGLEWEFLLLQMILFIIEFYNFWLQARFFPFQCQSHISRSFRSQFESKMIGGDTSIWNTFHWHKWHRKRTADSLQSWKAFVLSAFTKSWLSIVSSIPILKFWPVFSQISLDHEGRSSVIGLLNIFLFCTLPFANRSSPDVIHHHPIVTPWTHKTGRCWSETINLIRSWPWYRWQKTECVNLTIPDNRSTIDRNSAGLERAKIVWLRLGLQGGERGVPSDSSAESRSKLASLFRSVKLFRSPFESARSHSYDPKMIGR